MTKPYSVDLRERALARVQAGESVRSVADALSISASSVVKWSQRFRATGSVGVGDMLGVVRDAGERHSLHPHYEYLDEFNG